jgi:hypothetical protein
LRSVATNSTTCAVMNASCLIIIDIVTLQSVVRWIECGDEARRQMYQSWAIAGQFEYNKAQVCGLGQIQIQLSI